ncbi:beta-hexosaminidase [Humibacillus sp. DSM 29435]|nr:beta-hexosaminidase [Humibacillus sp. DSM 29435]
MRPTGRPALPAAATVLALCGVAGLLGACSSPAPTVAGTPTVTTPASVTSSSVPTASATSASSPPTSSASASSSSPASSTTGTPSPPPTSPPTSCSARIVSSLSASEQAGQLLMVGLDVNASRTSLDSLVTGQHLGGVILLGGWFNGAAAVRSTTAHLAGLASDSATGGLGLMLAADQEGGAVQQLRGAGFTRMPSARSQNSLSDSSLTAQATTWARQIKAAGVNVNLAPVADTVPASLGTGNGPIGQYGREFSSDPDDNAGKVSAFIAGMSAGGVASTVKHFPGIGRIRNNTDFYSTGITDTTTTTTDPYLRPFASGIRAGADMVMVGSAIYSRIDPGVNAPFSRAIVTDLLRGRLGYGGVVITDDVGAAKAVSGTPTGERATRFVDAGGDIVLSATPSSIPTMHAALTARMASDPAFAQKVEVAVTRVVKLKLKMGLARCG